MGVVTRVHVYELFIIHTSFYFIYYNKMEDYSTVDPDRLDFVNPLPDYFHLSCPVCLELLLPSVPMLAACCGSHFCESCVEKLRFPPRDDEDEDDDFDEEDLPCPFCKSEYLETIPDKNHLRALKSLKVLCTKNRSGCSWKGELGSLMQHLSSETDCTKNSQQKDSINACSSAIQPTDTLTSQPVSTLYIQ